VADKPGRIDQTISTMKIDSEQQQKYKNTKINYNLKKSSQQLSRNWTIDQSS
jgi:hypothetical protein